MVGRPITYLSPVLLQTLNLFFIGIPDEVSDYSRSLLHITAGSSGVDIRMSYRNDCNLFVAFGISDDYEDDGFEVECA